MMRSVVVVMGLIAGAGALSLAMRPASGAPPDPAAPVAALAASPFVGSQACAKCHEAQFHGWQETAHPLQERIATKDTVIADFATGEMLDLDGIPVRPFMDGDKFVIESSDAKGELVKYPIIRVVGGAMYKQRYVTRMPGGDDAVLPIEWNNREKKFQPFHANSGFKPGQAEFWGGPSRSWAYRCAGCHVVGLELTPAKAAGEWPSTRYVELGIGCESCHGAGREHASDPKKPIVNPARLSPDRVEAICASCHSRGFADAAEGAPVQVDYPIAYKAGDDDLHRVFRFTKPLEGLATWGYWSNKQSRQHHQQANDFERSAHFLRAGMSCTTCHMSHGKDRYALLRKNPRDNTLCVDCHADRASPERLEAHTHHKAASTGSVCVECHMPKVVMHANPNDLRAHTQWNPQPALDAKVHAPDACTLCHKDQDRPWAAAAVDRWRFGDKK